MLEMRGDRRAHIDEQFAQLRILRRRNQELVDRVEHRLVIADFTVDVGAVERGTVQRLERCVGLLGAAIQ